MENEETKLKKWNKEFGFQGNMILKENLFSKTCVIPLPSHTLCRDNHFISYYLSPDQRNYKTFRNFLPFFFDHSLKVS